MGTGFPEVLFSSQVATLKADKIPVINGFVTDKAGDGVVAIINGQPSYTKAGKALADFVLGTDGTAASSLFIGSTTFPASTFEQNAFVSENKRLCKSCAEVNLDEAATATQSQVINDVVAKITSDPSINFVVASQPTYAAGLPQALKTAGFGSVRILVNTPDPTTLGYLKAGEIAGIMNVPNTDAMDEFVDALARYEVRTVRGALRGRGRGLGRDQGDGPRGDRPLLLGEGRPRAVREALEVTVQHPCRGTHAERDRSRSRSAVCRPGSVGAPSSRGPQALP